MLTVMTMTTTTITTTMIVMVTTWVGADTEAVYVSTVVHVIVTAAAVFDVVVIVQVVYLK